MTNTNFILYTLFYIRVNCLLNKKILINFVQGPGTHKILWLSNHTPGYSLISCPGRTTMIGCI